MPRDRDLCLEAGFVAKPVATNRLIGTMKQSLDL